MKKEKLIKIYTDGSCLKNPNGPGGYGIVIIDNNKKYEFSGGSISTTNNRMELLAVINALKSLEDVPQRVAVYSDSEYVVNAINKGWLENWITNKQLSQRPNADLWKELHPLLKHYTPKFIWVKGHADNEYNNRADKLAKEAAVKYSKAKVKNSPKKEVPKYGIPKPNIYDPDFQDFIWKFYMNYRNQLDL